MSILTTPKDVTLSQREPPPVPSPVPAPAPSAVPGRVVYHDDPVPAIPVPENKEEKIQEKEHGVAALGYFVGRGAAVIEVSLPPPRRHPIEVMRVVDRWEESERI